MAVTPIASTVINYKIKGGVGKRKDSLGSKFSRNSINNSKNNSLSVS
jgi:hypothetical protein